MKGGGISMLRGLILLLTAVLMVSAQATAAGQILEGNTVAKIPVMQKFVHRVLRSFPIPTPSVRP